MTLPDKAMLLRKAIRMKKISDTAFKLSLSRLPNGTPPLLMKDQPVTTSGGHVSCKVSYTGIKYGFGRSPNKNAFSHLTALEKD